jgi:hypothetical protein
LKNKKFRDAYDFGQVLSTDLPKKRVANYSVRDQGLGSSNPAMKLKARPQEKIPNRDPKSGHQTVLDNTPLLPPRPNKKKGPTIPSRKKPLSYYFEGGKKSLKKRKKRKRGYGGKSPKRRTKKRKSRKKRKRTKTRRRKN